MKMTDQFQNNSSSLQRMHKENTFEKDLESPIVIWKIFESGRSSDVGKIWMSKMCSAKKIENSSLETKPLLWDEDACKFC